MNVLKEYAFSVFVISVILSVFLPLVVYRENSAVKLAAGVLLLYATVIPFAHIVPQLDFSLTPPAFEGGEADYELVAEDALKKAILSAVTEEFSIADDALSVELLGFDFEAMRAEKIILTLKGKALFKNYEKIEKFVTAIGCGECEVRVEI